MPYNLERREYLLTLAADAACYGLKARKQRAGVLLKRARRNPEHLCDLSNQTIRVLSIRVPGFNLRVFSPETNPLRYTWMASMYNWSIWTKCTKRKILAALSACYTNSISLRLLIQLCVSVCVCI